MSELKPKIFLSVLFLALSLSSLALDTDTIVADKIYKENIKSVLLFRNGWRLSYPIIELNGDVSLILKFDDLSDEIKNYQYKIVHCDSDWKPSPLSETEYMDGFFQNQIDDYDYSFNTYFSFVHYSLELPNEDVSINLSGNYAIIVYENYDENDVVFVKRFMVAEKITDIVADVSRPILSLFRDKGHQIDLSVYYGSYNIEDPFNDIKLVILQNGRWDNSISDLKPIYDKNKSLVYEYQFENVFMGGSEFRWFDIKSMRYQSPYIKSVEFIEDHFVVNLFPEEDKSVKQYFFEDDLNGKYYVEIQEELDNDTDADYVYVNITVPYETPFVDGNFYVMGALSSWGFNDENKMVYDFESNSYKLRLLLKQGYYNYQIAYIPENTGKVDLSYFEGNHYETENDYIILVYHKGTMSRYERLIGFQIINSLR